MQYRTGLLALVVLLAGCQIPVPQNKPAIPTGPPLPPVPLARVALSSAARPALGTLTTAEPSQNPPGITWTDLNEIPVTFNVYHTTDIALPMNWWPWLTNVSTWTWSGDLGPGLHFFGVKALKGGIESDWATR